MTEQSGASEEFVGSRLPPSRWAGIASASVWSVWGVMLAVALLCVARFGRDIPLAEDWTMVPALTGHEPHMGTWLWSQNNEHRVPLPRLLYLAVLRLTGGDFRSGMFLSTLLLGALAAAMIVTSRQIRGRTAFPDACFPLALLHLGNWINFAWSWQIQFVSSVALVGALLLVIVHQTGPLSSRAAVVAAAALVLLPLTGAIGLIFDAALAPWVLATARLHFIGRARRTTKTPGLLLAGALVIAAVTGILYFVGYQRPPWNPASPSLAATLKTAAMFLALGFGPVASASWRLSVLAAAVMLVPTLALLAGAAASETGAARLRPLGLLLFAGGIAVLALGIGWGRAALVPSIGLPDRYVLFAVPALCASFFAWQLYGQPRARRAVQAALLLAFAGMLPWNTRSGLFVRDWYVAGTDSVQRDIDAGLSPEAIAARRRAFLMHWDETGLAARIRMLREAGIGPFARNVTGTVPARGAPPLQP